MRTHLKTLIFPILTKAGRTDGPADRPKDGPTDPLILERIFQFSVLSPILPSFRCVLESLMEGLSIHLSVSWSCFCEKIYENSTEYCIWYFLNTNRQVTHSKDTLIISLLFPLCLSKIHEYGLILVKILTGINVIF